MVRRRAFTLVEILVVVAILSLLLLMLFPAFQGAIRSAKRARCLANMAGIGRAILDYAAANNNRLPSGSPPYGAKDPTNSAKVLNPYLKGEGYKVLMCPADVGDSSTDETPRFEDDGYSYWYANDESMRGQGISPVCGSISFQESRMGSLAGITSEDVRRVLGYYGSGPEQVPNPNDSARSRDITRDEIDNKAWPSIRSALDALKDKENFDVSSSAFQWRRTIGTYSPGSGMPSVKYESEYMGNGYPVPHGSHNASRWNHGNPWARTIYSIDYWSRSTRKVVLLDRDALFSFASPGATEAYPKGGRGFWHAYPYLPNPQSPTDRSKYYVRVHAAFLDGHAETIELNKFTSVNRDNDYY